MGITNKQREHLKRIKMSKNENKVSMIICVAMWVVLAGIIIYKL